DYTVELSYLLNKRSTISISGGYSVNTDPNRYFQLEPEDIGSLALVGTYVVKKYKTKTKTATGSYQYMLSPRSLITGTVMYSNFDTGVTDSSDFYMGLLQYQYDLSKTVKCNLIGSYNYMRFKFGGKADEGDIDFLEDLVSGGDYEVFFGSDFKSKMYSASAGLAYMFGKGSNINASLGWIRNVQNIKTETTDPETGDLITATRRPDGNTLNYNIGYTYSFSGSTIKLGLKQNAGDNANTGVSYRSRDLDLRIMHDINRRLAGNLTLKYYRYHSDEDDFGFEIKRHILYIMSNITYRATRWLNISLNYQYTNNHNKNIGRRTERNSVFFALTFQPLRPFVIR
ncbi:MAG: outer membrane beta-barrel protein, partial [Spirochaetes bacterium]|nr:outer membrane beta-barrel protein [Spirochaetota bacterium]